MRRSLLLVVALVGCASRERGDVLARVEQPFTATGSLTEIRETFGMVVLPGGSVMVAAGYGNASGTQHNEHWDKATGTWTKKKDLLTQRSFVSATALSSGKVVVLGGSDATGEIYDPTIDEWTAIADAGRIGAHETTLLSTGKLLVIGTNGTTWVQPRLYDPVADTWSSAGTMMAPREDHAAHLLYDGRVAILGGYNGSYLSSVELYTPATNTWSAGGALKAIRQSPASALLPDKRILIAGGYNGSALSSAEIYDPISNSSALTSSMSILRAGARAVSLPSGRVLVIGGDNGLDMPSSTSEVYDPATKKWSPGPNLTAPRYSFGAVVTGGRVLVVGGKNGPNRVSTAEVFGGLALGDTCVIDEECTTGKCDASKCAPAPVVDSGTDTMTASDSAVTDSEVPADTAAPPPDASPAADTGTPKTPPPTEDDGCGCRVVAPTPAVDSRAMLLLAGAIAALVRRGDNGSSGGRRTRR